MQELQKQVVETGLFGIIEEEPPKKRLFKDALMREQYGTHEGETCGTCGHLITKYGDCPASYYKCELYGQSSSEATDFRKKYLACGKWIPIGEARR